MDIPHFIAHQPNSPGVYLMYHHDQVIYVGKAKRLKTRLSSYFKTPLSDTKTAALVQQITRVETNLTDTETEALLLECTLIKKHRPRYNILLKDDKRYPYLYLSQDPFPLLTSVRKKDNPKGQYFGPYPNSASVRQTLNTLWKAFKIRNCQNYYFKNRSRPCLQYQIKRCSAPCVNLITEEAYALHTQSLVKFLKGQGHDVISDLEQKMNHYADRLAFEQAAKTRDLIEALKNILEKQAMEVNRPIDADAIAFAHDQNWAILSILSIRQGVVLGAKHFPHPMQSLMDEHDTFKQMLAQYYLQGFGKQAPPNELLHSNNTPDLSLLKQAIQKNNGTKIKFKSPQKGIKKRWLDIAHRNAIQALSQKSAKSQTIFHQISQLQKTFKLGQPPKSFACVDISHTFGEKTLGALVYFNDQGPQKNLYRKVFLDTHPADDLKAISETLMRLLESHVPTPDILLIDGGANQVKAAQIALKKLKLQSFLVGISKGPKRKVGEEKLWQINSTDPLLLEATDPTLIFLQRIRDEAHRFAIKGHTRARDHKRKTSILENIPGVGPKLSQRLYQSFESLEHIKKANLKQLQLVPGINATIAESIVVFFKKNG